MEGPAWTGAINGRCSVGAGFDRNAEEESKRKMSKKPVGAQWLPMPGGHAEEQSKYGRGIVRVSHGL